MFRVKLSIAVVLFSIFFAGCFDSGPQKFVIATSKSYESSIFRQQCAICHGPEAEGKTLDDGKIVPNLREGEHLKFRSEAEIYKQISEGGNGMTPFRGILTERELHLMAGFVLHDLRGQ